MKLAYTVDEACEIAGIGRTTFYDQVNRDACDWLSHLPQINPQSHTHASAGADSELE